MLSPVVFLIFHFQYDKTISMKSQAQINEKLMTFAECNYILFLVQVCDFPLTEKPQIFCISVSFGEVQRSVIKTKASASVSEPTHIFRGRHI